MLAEELIEGFGIPVSPVLEKERCLELRIGHWGAEGEVSKVEKLGGRIALPGTICSGIVVLLRTIRSAGHGSEAFLA